MAGHVAEKVAPHVKKHGTKLVPESLKKSKDGQASNFDGAKFVAAHSLQGMCHYNGDFRTKPDVNTTPFILVL